MIHSDAGPVRFNAGFLSNPAAAYPSGARQRRGAATDELTRVVDSRFDVVRIDFPLDGRQHSRKIWNHVDELRLDPELAACLARNGVRIGAASADAWEPIRAILDVAHAQVRRNHLVAQRGAPLRIRLCGVRDGESVFVHTRDGTLVGKTFPGGDKLLTLDYNFRPELGGCTDLKIQFEIGQEARELTWQKQAGTIRQLPAFQEFTFTDLTTPLRLSSGEFLVLGLNHEAQASHLLGRRFLTFESAGRRFETLLCVTPQPVAGRVVRRNPS